MSHPLPFYETEDDEDVNPAEYEDAGGGGSCGIDQRKARHWGGVWQVDG